MSIIELGALGEFVGSIGVIATLAYLAFQIRANTRATKATAGFEATHSWAQLNEQLGHLPDEQLEIFVGVFEDGYDVGRLSKVQQLRLTQLFRAVFQKLEGQYYLYKYGLLEPGLWKQRSSIGRSIIELPHFTGWWQGERKAKTFSSEFLDAIEQAAPMEASLIPQRLA